MAITEYFVRYLQRRDQLCGDDIDRLRAIRTTHERFQPGEIIVPQGRMATRSCMMLRGMAGRLHRTRAAERVITAPHVPGDFVDLHGFVLAGLEHEVVSMGPSEVEFVGHDELREITANFPHLTRLLWMSTVIDAAIHRQWLVASASLRSSAHLAHLLCEIYTRLATVGAAQNHVFALPLLQRNWPTSWAIRRSTSTARSATCAPPACCAGPGRRSRSSTGRGWSGSPAFSPIIWSWKRPPGKPAYWHRRQPFLRALMSRCRWLSCAAFAPGPSTVVKCRQAAPRMARWNASDMSPLS